MKTQKETLKLIGDISTFLSLFGYTCFCLRWPPVIKHIFRPTKKPLDLSEPHRRSPSPTPWRKMKKAAAELTIA